MVSRDHLHYMFHLDVLYQRCGLKNWPRGQKAAFRSGIHKSRTKWFWRERQGCSELIARTTNFTSSLRDTNITGLACNRNST